MEVPFFVYADALKRIQPDMRCDEAGIVGAFDANRYVIERSDAGAVTDPARAHMEFVIPRARGRKLGAERSVWLLER